MNWKQALSKPFIDPNAGKMWFHEQDHVLMHRREMEEFIKMNQIVDPDWKPEKNGWELVSL